MIDSVRLIFIMIQSSSRGKSYQKVVIFHRFNTSVLQQHYRAFIPNHNFYGIICYCFRLLSQVYDGAANMTGIHKGVKAEIQKIVPEAVFVYCKNHDINLDLHIQSKSIVGVVI